MSTITDPTALPEPPDRTVQPTPEPGSTMALIEAIGACARNPESPLSHYRAAMLIDLVPEERT